MKKDLSFVVKLQRPICRTPIKPVQKHKVYHPARGPYSDKMVFRYCLSYRWEQREEKRARFAEASSASSLSMTTWVSP